MKLKKNMGLTLCGLGQELTVYITLYMSIF